MDSVYNRLAYLGHLIRGRPPALSPTLDDFEMMQYIRPTVQPAENNFRILVSVRLFELKEIEIKVLLKKGRIEIRAKHERRQDLDGFWMTRDSTYTYELPKEVSKKELHAQWSEDDYLFIQTTSSNSDELDVEEITLIPNKVQRKMLPVVDVQHVKDHIENVRNKAQYIMRYIQFQTQNRPSPVEKEIQAIVDSVISGQSSRKHSQPNQGDEQTSDVTSQKNSSSDQQTSGISSRQTSGDSSLKDSPSEQGDSSLKDSPSEQDEK